MNKNPFYAAPEAELLVVRFEENIMSANSAGDGYGDNNLGDLDDDNN